jgi:hypothetical protein
VSEHDEDLELQALARQLDDAFETTRPRAGFDDELWLRLQSSRPAPRRLRDAMAGLWQGIRAVPAVPASAVALVLIVAVGVGIFAINGLHSGGGSSASNATSREAPGAGQYFAGSFGRLPSPVFGGATPKVGASPAATTAAPNGLAYGGPMEVTWAGTLDVHVTTAPVFRYREPTTNDADQFASALGAVLRERPSGFLGSYAASDYTLKVRGTVQSPASSPAYFIFSAGNMPAIDAAGGPQNLADVFLAEHSLQPQWQYTVSVDSSGDPIKVHYERQLEVPGYGPAYLVDSNANRYGIEVDLSANRPVLASGMLPMSLDVANYNVVSEADAIRLATASSVSGTAASPTPAPTLKLTQAELVYVLVPAGDRSFFEPAFLFTGKLQVGGQSYTGHVFVAAVDPSQRTS